jgi:hypothetical protein
VLRGLAQDGAKVLNESLSSVDKRRGKYVLSSQWAKFGDGMDYHGDKTGQSSRALSPWVMAGPGACVNSRCCVQRMGVRCTLSTSLAAVDSRESFLIAPNAAPRAACGRQLLGSFMVNASDPAPTAPLSFCTALPPSPRRPTGRLIVAVIHRHSFCVGDDLTAGSLKFAQAAEPARKHFQRPVHLQPGGATHQVDFESGDMLIMGHYASGAQAQSPW